METSIQNFIANREVVSDMKPVDGQTDKQVADGYDLHTRSSFTHVAEREHNETDRTFKHSIHIRESVFCTFNKIN